MPSNEYYEISLTQKALWLNYKLVDGFATKFNIQTGAGFRDIQVEKLNSAFSFCIANNEGLRTSFAFRDGVLMHKIHSPTEVGMEYIDLRSSPNINHAMYEVMLKDSATDFDLECPPLYKAKLLRITDERYKFIFTVCHCFFDPQSGHIFISELVGTYRNLLSGTATDYFRPKNQFRDYFLAGKEFRRSVKSQISRRHLEEAFRNLIDVSSNKLTYRMPLLTQDSDLHLIFRNSNFTFEPSRKTRFAISGRSFLSFRNLCKASQGSSFSMIIALFLFSLSRVLGTRAFIISFPAQDRYKKEFKTIIGYLVTGITVKIDVPSEITFVEYAKLVNDQILKAILFQQYALFDLLKDLDASTKFDRKDIVYFSHVSKAVAMGKRHISSVDESRPLANSYKIQSTEYIDGIEFNFLALHALFDSESEIDVFFQHCLQTIHGLFEPSFTALSIR